MLLFFTRTSCLLQHHIYSVNQIKIQNKWCFLQYLGRYFWHVYKYLCICWNIAGRISTEDSIEDQNDFWLSLPRTFSYQSSRFELPLNISVLTEISPLDYVSRYVSVSSSRRQLYNKVFVRHRSLKDGLLNEEVRRIFDPYKIRTNLFL